MLNISVIFIQKVKNISHVHSLSHTGMYAYTYTPEIIYTVIYDDIHPVYSFIM